MSDKNLKKQLTTMAIAADKAWKEAQQIEAEVKNKALKDMARTLLLKKSYILKENKKDISLARKNRLPAAFIDRLSLNEKRIKEMSRSLLEIAKLRNPAGEVIKSWKRPNGLRINKVRSPLGVVLIIYESRPNVTSDCIGLCFKTDNSVILRGGSESLNSNIAIYRVLKSVLKNYKIPANLINMVETPSRRAVDILLKLKDHIDLVIPRGGESLIRRVAGISRIPVIKHYKGICHIYVDEDADLNIAEKVCFNAKVQRPATCNAMETMLVHKNVAIRFLPGMIKKFKEAGVQIRGCANTKKIVKGIKSAKEKDYSTEYLDLILSVKVVDSLAEAVEHINFYGSGHSDAIITDNKRVASEFLGKVDSACVYVNASTRFTDGFQFGMGAEMGISTDKLHARGPMSLEELTTYKYMIFGSGQVRE
ncbi:MAG: glutamate-5-semialdehyde dehydrogenase [Candidatus Omnitrophota bacterium]|nr:MAG: glutamate-5-semialdehyde dehydrogenase [Candidatus Omnitrophota bacterium]